MTSSDSQGIVPQTRMEFIWRAQVAAICAALVSGVAGARLAMLPNEREGALYDGWRNRDRRDKKERGSRSSSIVGADGGSSIGSSRRTNFKSENISCG